MDDKLLEGINRDFITNLPYLDSFCAVSGKYLRENDVPCHIVAFDVANFKLINKNYGFREGDIILNAIIKKCCIDNPSCIVATRVYSDHVIGLYKTEEEAEKADEKIIRFNREIKKAMQDKYPIVPFHIHSGLFYISDRQEHITNAIDKANMARKAAKGNYNRDCVIYDDKILKKHERVAEVITILKDSLKNKNVLVLLQPKMEVTTHRLVGAEALSRLVDKNGNIISPDEFIPILEKSGKITELDMYVMEYVMNMVEGWYMKGIKDVSVSINLSRMDFYSDTLIDDIKAEFAKHKMPAELIEFEVTESVFLNDTDMIIEKITQIKELGFKVSIDDFGSGYSSLNLISVLPVDIIKLDKGFIRTGINSEKGREIMRGIIEILKKIKFGIICEGIENSIEENTVFECGCNQVQGYLYDKPIKVNDFVNKYLNTRE